MAVTLEALRKSFICFRATSHFYNLRKDTWSVT